MNALIESGESGEKNLTDRCLKACGEVLAPIIYSHPQRLGEELVGIARREGWATSTYSAPATLIAAAREKAHRNDTSVSAVIRTALESYVKGER